MTYSKVINGEIVEHNKTLPFASETTMFGVNATPEELSAEGYYPVVGTEPVYDSAFQRIGGVSYSFDGTQVNKVYAVVDIPLEELQAKAIERFKQMYLARVDAKLKELDYDSLATVKLWEGDATFGAEATRILNWYKAIITMNYQLIDDVTAGTVTMPTEAEYQAMLDAVVF